MRRKTVLASFCLLMLLVFIGCTKSYAVTDFSYVEDRVYYTEDIPGVQCSGFKNTVPCKIDSAGEAVEHAKNEVTVGYNQISVCYDKSEKVWAIIFYTKNMSGGNQTVYIDDNGITLMCVYGE